MAYITNKTTNKTGSNITINNAINYKLLGMQLLGNLEQDGTPTPSSPIPIDVVTGLQNVTINDTTYSINLGKNFIYNKNGASSGEYGDVQYTINEDGTISVVGTATSNYNFYLMGGNNQLVLPPGTYTLSGGISSDAWVRLYGGGEYIDTTTSQPSKTFTITQTTNYNVILRVKSGTTVDGIFKPQLERGTTATEYATYFPPIELCTINDYQDKIYKSNGKWYIEKQIGKVVLDGSEQGWNVFFSTNGIYVLANYIQSKTSGTDIQCKSNYFDATTRNNIRNNLGTVDNVCATNGGEIILANKSISSLNDFKTWLGNHNTTLYTILATPETTEITNTELISQLEALSKAKLNYGTNNIIVNGIIPSILDLTAYTSENPYQDVIYSQDDRNKAKIWFNDVEMVDFGTKCEKITKTARILPNDGKKVFSLSNFVATELEVILHDVNVEDLVDQVKISIGTIVGSDSLGDIYEYVPLGIFNIQDQPVINDNKITLKLRDNRVKFDFNYSAKQLLDDNGGTATKKQILNDICTQVGVTNTIDSFIGENDLVSVYDDSVKANVYVAYLLEQGGEIPTIDRYGNLIKIDFENLYTWRIPLRLMPKPLKIGTPYKIERVVYESGIIKYESSNDETLDTLYINSNNPYIYNQEQIDNIYNYLKDFTIDTVTTQNFLGNPAIDPYDLIEVYDDSDENEPVIFKTFANNVYTFNGKHKHSISTEIGKEQRKENVTITGLPSLKKWAETRINNLEAEVIIETGKVKELEGIQEKQYIEIMNEFNEYAPITSIQTITNQVTQLQTDTYTKTQIQEIANGDGYDFAITTDTNYLADKEYYSYDDTNKTYTLLVAGTDYQVGDAISGDVYNKYSITVTAVVSTEARFDKTGMHYSQTGAETSSTINNMGFEVDDKTNKEIFYAGYDDDENSITYGTSIVRTDNINVDTYLQFAYDNSIGEEKYKGRFEEFTDSDNNKGIGLFLM